MGGRWIKKYKNWLEKETAVEKSEQIDNEKYGVPFIPLRCPQCKSKDVRCYVSRPPVRYHVCRKCKIKFKSVEVDDAKQRSC
jgi:hypothetical protein